MSEFILRLMNEEDVEQVANIEKEGGSVSQEKAIQLKQALQQLEEKGFPKNR